MSLDIVYDTLLHNTRLRIRASTVRLSLNTISKTRPLSSTATILNASDGPSKYQHAFQPALRMSFACIYQVVRTSAVRPETVRVQSTSYLVSGIRTLCSVHGPRSSYLLTWRVNYVLRLKSPEIACQPCWTATPITCTRTSAYA